MGYKLLVTQCAIAVCTDLISSQRFHVYIPWFYSLPDQLPVPYVSGVFVSVLLTQREQTIQSGCGVCRTDCARLTLMLPAVRSWKSELPSHLCLFLNGKSLVLGYKVILPSLLPEVFSFSWLSKGMFSLSHRGSICWLVNSVAQIPCLGAWSSSCCPQVSKWKPTFWVKLVWKNESSQEKNLLSI